jgi:hypothetical protein
MAKKNDQDSGPLDVIELVMKRLELSALGYTPMIMNRFDFKAQQQLLLPSPKKNAAERATTLKHDPVAEFRGAIYKNRNPKEPAAIHLPVNAFAKAIAAAAIDIPGATRSQIERLTSVTTVNINLFGVPRLFTTMVRNSDPRRTPDMRTRAIFPEWACTITIQYVANLIKDRSIANLMAAAGGIIGIGDWRPQKGGSYGKFEVVSPENKLFKEICKKQGRVAQLAAMETPVCFDEDTESLLAWFTHEVKRRQMHVPSDGPRKRGNSKERPLLPPNINVHVEDARGNLVG